MAPTDGGVISSYVDEYFHLKGKKVELLRFHTRFVSSVPSLWFQAFFGGVSHVSFNVRNSCVLRSLFPFSRTISLRHAIFLRCREPCSRCQQVSSLCQSIFLPCRVTLSPCQDILSPCHATLLPCRAHHSPCQSTFLPCQDIPLPFHSILILSIRQR